jgi:signal peptidase I
MKKHEKNRCRKCLALALGLAPTLLLVVCVALLAATHNPRKSFFGRRFQIALTSSMAPRIRKNELLVIKNAIPEELQVGDIAVLAFGNDSDNRFLVSRVTMASQ